VTSVLVFSCFKFAFDGVCSSRFRFCKGSEHAAVVSSSNQSCRVPFRPSQATPGSRTFFSLVLFDTRRSLCASEGVPDAAPIAASPTLVAVFFGRGFHDEAQPSFSDCSPVTSSVRRPTSAYLESLSDNSEFPITVPFCFFFVRSTALRSIVSCAVFSGQTSHCSFPRFPPLLLSRRATLVIKARAVLAPQREHFLCSIFFSVCAFDRITLLLFAGVLLR